VVATAAFVRWNGYRLQFADREMYDWLMGLYDTGHVTKDNLEEWVRAHAIAIP
jgi:prophage maintenance system killer protein